MFPPSMKVRPAVAALLLAAAVGCERQPPLNTAPADFGGERPKVGGAFAAIPLGGEQKGDNRSYWTYDGGHVAQGTGEAWFEQNPEADKTGGKPWEFREVSRTKEYVELYDTSRGVTVRLTATEMQARWDKDGKNADWQTLQKGKWGRPE